jgi:hypothetical protein
MYTFFTDFNFLYSHCQVLESLEELEVVIYLNDWRCESFLLSRFRLNVRDYGRSLEYINFRKKLRLDEVNKERYGRLGFIEGILSDSVNRIFKKPVKIRYLLLDDDNLNSGVVLGYIREKLKQGQYLRGILNKLQRSLLKLCHYNKIGGFYIVCKGRFSKAPRASKMVIKGGFLGFSNCLNNIEYNESIVILKYGLLSINVWILKKKVRGSRSVISL